MIFLALPQRLGPVARVDEVGGEKLEAAPQVVAIGGASERAASSRTLKLSPSGLARKEALESSMLCLPRPPVMNARLARKGETGLGRWLGEPAPSRARMLTWMVLASKSVFLEVEGARQLANFDEVDVEIIHVLMARGPAPGRHRNGCYGKPPRRRFFSGGLRATARYAS